MYVRLYASQSGTIRIVVHSKRLLKWRARDDTVMQRLMDAARRVVKLVTGRQLVVMSSAYSGLILI